MLIDSERRQEITLLIMNNEGVREQFAQGDYGEYNTEEEQLLIDATLAQLFPRLIPKVDQVFYF